MEFERLIRLQKITEGNVKKMLTYRLYGEKGNEMKEYKIVCDMTTENVMNGKTMHYEGVSPITSGATRELRIYKDKTSVTASLEYVIEKCRNFDAKTRDNVERYPRGTYELIYTQFNFRILSRTVSEWK